jgi:hypothetical protein
MKKGALALALILAAAVLAPAQQVSFKLMGGLSWINGSDYNDGIAGDFALFRATSTTVSGSFANLTGGAHFQAELITHINGWLAVGLGGGYYRVSNTSTVSSGGLATDGTPYTATSTLSPQVSVIPFSLNVHYFADLGPKLKIDAYAGPVFFIVQTHIENPGTLTTANTSTLELFTASASTLGAQAGLGLSYQLMRRISILVDASYHFGSYTDIQGNWVKNTTSDAGFTSLSSDSYFMWSYNYTQGATYQQYGFFDANGPTGAGISKARKTKIDISGLMISAGVRISF